MVIRITAVGSIDTVSIRPDSTRQDFLKDLNWPKGKNC
jgi:hypothetical protein